MKNILLLSLILSIISILVTHIFIPILKEKFKPTDDLPTTSDCKGNYYMDKCGQCVNKYDRYYKIQNNEIDEDGILTKTNCCENTGLSVLGLPPDCNGICGGSNGTIPEGDCDCSGNELDASGICGGENLTNDKRCDGVKIPHIITNCGECMNKYRRDAEIDNNIRSNNDTQLICNKYEDGKCVDYIDTNCCIDKNVGPRGEEIDCSGICGGKNGTIPKGDCDCSGNELDASGICGGGNLTDDARCDGVIQPHIITDCGKCMNKSYFKSLVDSNQLNKDGSDYKTGCCSNTGKSINGDEKNKCGYCLNYGENGFPIVDGLDGNKVEACNCEGDILNNCGECKLKDIILQNRIDKKTSENDTVLVCKNTNLDGTCKEVDYDTNCCESTNVSRNGEEKDCDGICGGKNTIPDGKCDCKTCYDRNRNELPSIKTQQECLNSDGNTWEYKTLDYCGVCGGLDTVDPTLMTKLDPINNIEIDKVSGDKCSCDKCFDKDNKHIKSITDTINCVKDNNVWIDPSGNVSGLCIDPENSILQNVTKDICNNKSQHTWLEIGEGACFDKDNNNLNINSENECIKDNNKWEPDVVDDCGVCGGRYEIPEGDCDCDGNKFDECGICGGEGIDPKTKCCPNGKGKKPTSYIKNECGICENKTITDYENNCCPPNSPTYPNLSQLGQGPDASGLCGGTNGLDSIIPDNIDAARQTALALGLKVDHEDFAGDYNIKGFHSYRKGPNFGKAYFGTGGSKSDNIADIVDPVTIEHANEIAERSGINMVNECPLNSNIKGLFSYKKGPNYGKSFFMNGTVNQMTKEIDNTLDDTPFRLSEYIYRPVMDNACDANGNTLDDCGMCTYGENRRILSGDDSKDNKVCCPNTNKTLLGNDCE